MSTITTTITCEKCGQPTTRIPYYLEALPARYKFRANQLFHENPEKGTDWAIETMWSEVDAQREPYVAPSRQAQEVHDMIAELPRYEPDGEGGWEYYDPETGIREQRTR